MTPTPNLNSIQQLFSWQKRYLPSAPAGESLCQTRQTRSTTQEVKAATQQDGLFTYVLECVTATRIDRWWRSQPSKWLPWITWKGTELKKWSCHCSPRPWFSQPAWVPHCTAQKLSIIAPVPDALWRTAAEWLLTCQPWPLVSMVY